MYTATCRALTGQQNVLESEWFVAHSHFFSEIVLEEILEVDE